MKLARIALAFLFLAGTACSSVQTVRDPAHFMATRPELVMVVFDDGSEMPVAQPQVRGDTLFGTWQGLNEPAVAPLSQVRRVDAIQKDSKRTALLVIGLAAASSVMTYGFTRLTDNTGIVCSYDRGVDDTGNPGRYGEEKCFKIRG